MKYEKQAYIAIITLENISECVFDMGEYLDDLESDLENIIEDQDFFPCMHFESLSDHDWDDENETLIADDTILLLIVLQWEDVTLPRSNSKTPTEMLENAFKYHIGKDGVRGYFDSFQLYETTGISTTGIKRMQEGWTEEEEA